MTRVRESHAGRAALRTLGAAGLGVDAYVHLHLAARFDTAGSALSESTLFRTQAALAVLAALALLLHGRRAAAAFGLLVSAAALGAVLLYRYVDVGPLGPLPDMYDPAWYGEKTCSALAEAVAILACALLLLAGPARRTSHRARGAPNP